jgi:hypothetical protein
MVAVILQGSVAAHKLTIAARSIASASAPSVDSICMDIAFLGVFGIHNAYEVSRGSAAAFCCTAAIWTPMLCYDDGSPPGAPSLVDALPPLEPRSERDEVIVLSLHESIWTESASPSGPLYLGSK